MLVSQTVYKILDTQRGPRINDSIIVVTFDRSKVIRKEILFQI